MSEIDHETHLLSGYWQKNSRTS